MKLNALKGLLLVGLCFSCKGVRGGGGEESELLTTTSRVRSLLYPADWKPGYQVKIGDRTLGLQDYSYAGYRQGEAPLPTGDFFPVVTAVAPLDGKADAAPAIQKVIDELVQKKEAAIIYVPPGLYRLDQSLRIPSDRLVLRGAGPVQTRFQLSNPTVSIILGPDKPVFQNNPGWVLTQDVAEGSFFVELKDKTDLKVGQDVYLSWIVSQELAAEYGSTPWWEAGQLIGDRVDNFRRVITAIEGNRIYVNAPFRLPIKLRDAPQLRRVVGMAVESGLENFGVTSALPSVKDAWETFTAGGTPAIRVNWVRDGWVRNIESFALPDRAEHLASHGLSLGRSYRLTIDKVQMQKAQHLGAGGHGYLFIVGGVNEVLIRDCRGVDGRHNLTFVGPLAASGNVILRFASRGGRVCSSLEQQLANRCSVGPVDTHEPLAIANLFDNLAVQDGLQVGNRQEFSNNVGQTGTLNVMWATRGAGKLYSFNAQDGFVIGTEPTIETFTKAVAGNRLIERLQLNAEPEDYSEHLKVGAALEPQSLYEDQLRRRLRARASK